MSELLDPEFEAPSEPPPLLGFDQVRHLAYHGWLPLDLPERFLMDLQGLTKESQQFFDQDDQKKAILYPSSHGTECGFYQVLGEKEYITFRRRVFQESALEQRAGLIWTQAASILHRILCDLTRAGSYDIHAWDHLVEDSLVFPKDDSNLEKILTLMRLFRYYPEAGTAEAHVDIGLLTLCIGDGEGLQVLNRNTQEYVDATGPVVITGDFARALLRNRVRAGKHRVTSNPRGRCSIVFALRPNLVHATDLSMFGGQGTVDTGEFFYRIKGKKYNINATKDIREKQQEEQRAKREQRLPRPPSG